MLIAILPVPGGRHRGCFKLRSSGGSTLSSQTCEFTCEVGLLDPGSVGSGYLPGAVGFAVDAVAGFFIPVVFSAGTAAVSRVRFAAGPVGFQVVYLAVRDSCFTTWPVAACLGGSYRVSRWPGEQSHCC